MVSTISRDRWRNSRSSKRRPEQRRRPRGQAWKGTGATPRCSHLLQSTYAWRLQACRLPRRFPLHRPRCFMATRRRHQTRLHRRLICCVRSGIVSPLTTTTTGEPDLGPMTAATPTSSGGRLLGSSDLGCDPRSQVRFTPAIPSHFAIRVERESMMMKGTGAPTRNSCTKKWNSENLMGKIQNYGSSNESCTLRCSGSTKASKCAMLF